MGRLLPRARLTAALVLLAATILAGCASGPPAEASLTIDFDGQGHVPDVVEHRVRFDPDHRPALPAYRDRDREVEHPDFYSVHDLMAQWSEDEGVPVRTGYFDGLGFTLDAVDGVAGTFSDTECRFWSLSVDGEASELGMGAVQVTNGMAVAWTYTDCS